MNFSLSVDPKLDQILGNQMLALQKAAAITLNHSAQYAKVDLLKALQTKIDKPSPFTTNEKGYQVQTASLRGGAAVMSSEMNIGPRQSRYERKIFTYGVRRIGDAGASARHAWVPGQRPGFKLGSNYSIQSKRSGFGGVPNKYSQNLYGMSVTKRCRSGSGLPTARANTTTASTSRACSRRHLRLRAAARHRRVGRGEHQRAGDGVGLARPVPRR